MVRRLKKFFYFPLAYYFRIFAQIQLSLWKPSIIVVTGSSGKTTLLHLIEAQLGNEARYSHHANSAYGIPFDILGLKRKDLVLTEWFSLVLSAPFKAFKSPYKQPIYIVEADCDRPGEGNFLGSLLNPEITIWLSSSRTHSMNFKNRQFKSIEDTIAYEFGHFLKNTSSLAIINKDSQVIKKQLTRTKAKIEPVSIKYLKSYSVSKDNSSFKTKTSSYNITALLPEETFYSIEAVSYLLSYLKHGMDSNFSKLQLPPGRSSVFKGIKNTTIIDSSYNTSLDGMSSMLKLLKTYPGKEKWTVIGDILEQGEFEQEEHEELAKVISQTNPDKVILIGPRVSKYTYPKLTQLLSKSIIEKFEKPTEVLEYLRNNISGGEIILFKGARFLEGVIERLLEDKKDIDKLCRREKIWQMRRQQWGL